MHSNELYHHGIKDQRWGIRNGPPYPLSKDKKEHIKRVAKNIGSKTLQIGKNLAKISLQAAISGIIYGTISGAAVTALGTAFLNSPQLSNFMTSTFMTSLMKTDISKISEFNIGLNYLKDLGLM